MKAFGEYGALGKLIKKGAIEEPEEPNRLDFDIQDKFEQYRKKKADVKRDKPNLYAFILKYTSDESLEAVQKGEGGQKQKKMRT
jgi:hypothetical protein